MGDKMIEAENRCARKRSHSASDWHCFNLQNYIQDFKQPLENTLKEPVADLSSKPDKALEILKRIKEHQRPPIDTMALGFSGRWILVRVNEQLNPFNYEALARDHSYAKPEGSICPINDKSIHQTVRVLEPAPDVQPVTNEQRMLPFSSEPTKTLQEEMLIQESQPASASALTSLKKRSAESESDKPMSSHSTILSEQTEQYVHKETEPKSTMKALNDDQYIKKYQIKSDFPYFRMKRVDNVKKIKSSIKVSNISAYTTDKTARSFQAQIKQDIKSNGPVVIKTEQKENDATNKIQEIEDSFAGDVIEIFKVERRDGSSVKHYIAERPVNESKQTADKVKTSFTPISKLPSKSILKVYPEN